MSNAVIPRWEIHIKPMFNLMDRIHMSYRMDFEDPD